MNALTPEERRALAEAQANRDEAIAALPMMQEAIEEGGFIFLTAERADPGAECWAWLRGFIGLAYDLIKQHRLYRVRVLFTFASYERRGPR